MTLDARSAGHERLRRLLFLVPYVARHQGQTVEEVASTLGLSKEALLEDLDLLTMVGRPPFQPDDFVDIYVEDDRVYVDLDQRLSAPPRLTASEGVALAAAVRLLQPMNSKALTGVLEKLERVLPKDARARYHAQAQSLDVAAEAPSDVALLSTAISDRAVVTFEYWSAGREAKEARTVRPLELRSHRGQWYLSAFCLTRQEERLFRLDRINQPQRTGEVFDAHGEAPPARSSTSVRSATVRFFRESARYARERFGHDGVNGPGGSFEVQVPADSEPWLVRWVLSFGGDAVVISPTSAREAVARAAEASLHSKAS